LKRRAGHSKSFPSAAPEGTTFAQGFLLEPGFEAIVDRSEELSLLMTPLKSSIEHAIHQELDRVFRDKA